MFLYNIDNDPIWSKIDSLDNDPEQLTAAEKGMIVSALSSNNPELINALIPQFAPNLFNEILYFATTQFEFGLILQNIQSTFSEKPRFSSEVKKLETVTRFLNLECSGLEKVKLGIQLARTIDSKANHYNSLSDKYRDHQYLYGNLQVMYNALSLSVSYLSHDLSSAISQLVQDHNSNIMALFAKLGNKLKGTITVSDNLDYDLQIGVVSEDCSLEELVLENIKVLEAYSAITLSVKSFDEGINNSREIFSKILSHRNAKIKCLIQLRRLESRRKLEIM